MPKSLLKRRAALVDDFLKNYLDKWPEIPSRLREAMLYSLEAGGKRLRPVLCMSTASLYGMPEEAVLPFACAIELVHTYSLIHDDLPAMDNDDLRRGKPSNHKQFDEATAILAGDGLLTDAFALIAELPLPSERLLAAIAELAAGAGTRGMVGGQMLDMEYTGKEQISLADVAHMQSMKTGALITAACVCGALLAGAEPEKIAAIRKYGQVLGKAFQICDDILDITGKTEELGKPAGSDAARGKNTWPSLVGIEESRKVAKAAVKQACEAIPGDSPDAIFLRNLAEFTLQRSA